MNLAFVLLPEARMPVGDDVARAFSEISPEESVTVPAPAPRDPEDPELLQLDLASGRSALIMLMAEPVPDGEAEEAAAFSIGTMGREWEPTHEAHLMVTLAPLDGESPSEALSTFTTLLAAIAKSSGAVAIYWGNAGATHETEFFDSIARDPDHSQRIALWTGVSTATDADGTLELLSLGMTQLELPNLLLVTKSGSAEEAFGMFFDLLSYVAERGEAIPEGETIGSSESDRVPVNYVPSPVDPEQTVWRVETP